MILKDWALSYIENDIPIFPLKPNTKVPIYNGGVHSATTDFATVVGWWTKHPNANIGIPMGKVSNLMGLDIDFKDGASKDIVTRIPATYMTRTPTGGLHAIYGYPDGGIKNGKKLEKGVTVRADGFYFVFPGSIHPETVTAYEPYIKEFPLWKSSTVDCPQWIIEHGGVTNDEVKKENGKIPIGARHDVLKNYAVALRFDGKQPEEINKVLGQYQQTFQAPLPSSEVDSILKWVMEHVTPTPKEPIDIANAFIKTLDKNIIIHRGQFYDYVDTHYEAISDDNLLAQVHGWLRNSGKKLSAMVGKPGIKSVVRAFISPPHFIDESLELPIHKTPEGYETRKHLMPVKNGILNIKNCIYDKDNRMEPHTPDFIAPYCLPYEYTEGATCPFYDEISLKILGSKQAVQTWEEVLGLHLYQPFNLERFFVLQGEGRNGKSVLVCVLTCLLGQSNISSIPLQLIKPESFAFTQTYGKLANIISDCDDIDIISEGLIKQFVTREPMTFQRKFKDPFLARPTALLTICTNPMPRFLDKSDGIWRRLCLFRLTNQVEEGKEDRRLIDPEFWEQSGELPGVLNRALEGIKRVVARGNLLEMDSMVREKEEYRYDLNPVAQFVGEYCEFGKSLEEPTATVYRSYREMCHTNGNKPMAAAGFARLMKTESKRIGHPVETTKVRRQGNYVGKFWNGMALTHEGKRIGLKLIESEKL